MLFKNIKVGGVYTYSSNNIQPLTVQGTDGYNLDFHSLSKNKSFMVIEKVHFGESSGANVLKIIVLGSEAIGYIRDDVVGGFDFDGT